MWKYIVLLFLVLTTTYCTFYSYQATQWMMLLKKKKMKFGKETQNNLNLRHIQTLQKVCMTSMVLVLIMPNNLALFNSPDRNIEKSSLKGVPAEGSPSPVDSGNDVVNDALVAPEETTKMTSTALTSISSTLIEDWTVIQNNLSNITILVIESYEEAPNVLSEVKARSLLANKKPTLVKQIELKEMYEIKVEMNNQMTYVFSLASLKDEYYLLDEMVNEVYYLK